MESRFLSGLNPMQQEAVLYIDGPLLILAGAGSGKTKVLTHRTGYLIESGVLPRHILAITFTNKAAGEMRERIARLLPSESESVFISTFHSMCVRILRQHIDKLSYGRDFVIYDGDDQRTLVRNVIKKLELDTKIYRERGIAKLISNRKNSLTSPGAYYEEADSFYDQNAARIYEEYERELRLNNALDFDDLLIKTVELFNGFPEILSYWQDRFRYIEVDEYQDTNNVQFEIVRALAGKDKNLCVVGDDDQSIYKFRGANIENILSFEKSFPGAKVVKLEQNYRSTARILSAANEVIRHNLSRKDKSLWTENSEGEIPCYREYETASGEAEAIIDAALKRKLEGVSLGSQAVLYRTNRQSRLFEERCVALGVPYIIVGGVNFYQRKEIKDILSYLRLIANSRDDLSLRRVINVPKRGIGSVTLDRIAAYAGDKGISMYEAALMADSIAITGSAKARIKEFTSYIEGLRESLTGGLIDIPGVIRDILNNGGYEDEIKKEDPAEGSARLENIEELIDKASSYEEGGMASLHAFLEEVSLIADIDRSDLNSDHLTMMTLHAAKGLEFDEVYLSGMEEGLFPTGSYIDAADPQAEIEEERRLCYVGITRAKKRLTLSSSSQRMRNGELMMMKHSRFIDEIPDSSLKKYFRKKGLSLDTMPGSYRAYRPKEAPRGVRGRFGSLDMGISLGAKALTKTKPLYGIGDRVRHIKFGEGTVSDITEETKDYKVTVNFDEVGIKSMYAGFARLEKL